MPGEVSVAVVGTGYWGPKVIRALHRTEGIWLKLVCDLQANRLEAVKAQLPQVAVTTVWENVLADRTLDSVVLVTPPATHFQLARAALAAGKHVWVEKPLALAYRHGAELVRLAQQAGRTLFVDETFLYDPLVWEVRSRIIGGQLGRIYHVSLERTGMGRIRRDSNVWWNSAPHDLSVLRYILEAPVSRVSVVGSAHVQPGIEDVVWASLQLAGHISTHLYLNWLFPEKRARLTVVGELGMLTYEGRFENRKLTHSTYRLGPVSAAEIAQANLIPIEETETAETLRGDQAEPLLGACRAFRESILDRRSAPSSGEHSLPTLAALEAGACSLAQHGAWIDVCRPKPGQEGTPRD